MFSLKQLIIEQKVYRRRRKMRLSTKRADNRILKIRAGDITKYASKVIQFILEQGGSRKYTSNEIDVPQRMCFKSNFIDCVNFLNDVVLAYCNNTGNLILNFSNCKEASISALITLKTILEELLIFGQNTAKSRYKEKAKSIRMIPSKSNKINRYLFTLHVANFPVSEEEQREYISLGLHRGKSRNYKENRKSVVSRIVTQFVENTAERFSVGFDERGQNYMEGMVGEILSNAEDHSLKKSEWFVDGVSFLHKEKDNEVIEFNLAIINYGYSMYDGFEQTKNENYQTYEKLEWQYKIHKNLFSITKKFEREPLFVLYMLNEGISRLKYLEPSRGNGTMTFIKSFIELGKFCNEDSSYEPEMNIISGHTVLTCTEEYAPFSDNNHYKLTLNKEKSLSALPDSSVLKYFAGAVFPGTILDCKIFLNKRDLEKNIKDKVNN